MTFKKPNKSAVTRVLQNKGFEKHYSALDAIKRGDSPVQGFHLADFGSRELYVSYRDMPTNPKPESLERISRLSSFWRSTLDNAGYKTESYRKGFVIANPDRVYGPPKPPELETSMESGPDR